MLQSVRFHGFKSLRDVELSGLQQLNVIVGPSGVGKSSVLQGVDLLARLSAIGPTATGLGSSKSIRQHRRASRVRRVFRGRMVPERIMTSGERSLVLSCESDSEQMLALRVDLEEVGASQRFEFSLRGPGQEVATLVLPEQNDDEASFFEHEFLRQLGSAVFLKFDAERLGATSASSRKPVIRSNGSGLATVLAYFAGAYRDRLQSLETELREVLEISGQIRTFPDELESEDTELIRIDDELVPRTLRRTQSAHRFEVEIDGLGSVPGDLLSEGTLTTLGLLAILHQPDCPRTLLLDDIDQGLHPEAQARLVAALRRILAARPDTQIICTSHSPYLLDHFAPEEVQVMTMADGRVSAARLDKHEEWPRWAGKLQTGEFWQSVGEDWVAAGPTTREAAND